jgi:hypothetical protein
MKNKFLSAHYSNTPALHHFPRSGISGPPHSISEQRSDGVFLLETEWLFEGL